MEGAEVYSGSFVAELESAVVAEPRQRPFDDVSCLSHAATVRAAAWGQQGGDHQPNQELDYPHESVASVALQGFGLGVHPSSLVPQMRKLLEHRLNQFLIALVRWPRLDHERNTVGVADNMAFAAIFPTIRGVGTCMFSTVKGSDRSTIDDDAVGLENIRSRQRLEQLLMNAIPDAGLRPLVEPTPTCAVADTEIAWQHVPRDAATEDIHDSFETATIIQARRPAKRRAWMLRQQRLGH